MRFDELPDPIKKTTDWFEVAALLRGRPKDWACVREADSYTKLHTVASKIRLAQSAAFRDGGFESVVRPVPDGDGYGLWVRYVGEH